MARAHAWAPVRRAALLLAVLPLLAAGCLREFEEPNFLRIVSIDAAAPRVSSGAALLVVHVTLDNGGGASGPVRVAAKAFDLSTGLLARVNDTSLGSVAKDRSVPLALGLEVPRQSGYRVEVVVYEDDRIAQTGQLTVSNVGALQPNLFDTGLRIGAMDFIVRNVTGRGVDIQAGVYVTDEGIAASRPLRMQLKAREVTTGLVSDEAWVDVPGVGAEETRIVSAVLQVPGGYNYEVEAVLWDDIMVGRGTGKVQLLPTFTKDTSQELMVTRPEIRDFVRGELAERRSAAERQAARAPGFEAVLALAGLGAALLLACRGRG